MKNFFRGIALLLVLGGMGFTFFNYYSYIFAKTVTGQISNIEKVTNAVAVVGGSGNQSVGDKTLFSVAILIKDVQGKFWPASSEDRQWGIAEKGTCVVAKLFPYAPWEFSKGSTYFGARLESVVTCEDIGMKSLTAEPPAASASPEPTNSPNEVPAVSAGAEAAAAAKGNQ